MYVQSFRRWIVDDKNGNANGEKSTSCDASNQVEPLKGAGHANNLPMDEGWVNPTTINELWWPRDLSTLQIRPMMNVLFRSGILSYVSVGLDVRVPHSNNGNDDDDVVIESWRNYGMNSQPIARQWTTLDIAMEKVFHLEGFILEHNGNDDDDDGVGYDPKYETLFPSLNVQNVMQRVATFTAELDSLSPLAEGFHIASFPMMEDWSDLPTTSTTSKNNGEGGGKDGDETEVIYKIVCMATSEPFANKLLDMDEDLLTMSSTSVLEVEVMRTAKGGDSPYLTEPYKALYLNR